MFTRLQSAWSSVRRALLGVVCVGLTGAAASAAPGTVTTTDELRQGSVNAVVTLHGSGLAAATAVDFGADVTVHGFTAKGGGARLEVTVSVADLAAAGDRTVTVTLPADTATGTIRCAFPGDLLMEGLTDDREPSRNPAVVGVNVFAKNGEFFMSRTDIATRGRMIGLAWSRSFQSNNVGFNGALGRGWVGYYFQRAVYVAGGARPGIRAYTPEGRTELYPAMGPGQFGRPAGVYMKAERDAVTGAITLTDRHGFACFFDGIHGKLQKCRDRNGNESRCHYSPTTNQLEAVEDDLGRRYKIETYPHGRVKRVVDEVWSVTAPRTIEYAYTAKGELATVAAAETARYSAASGNRTTYAYQYDNASRIVGCTNPREFAASGPPYLTVTYDAQGRVIEQRLGEVGRNLQIRYLQGGGLVRTIDRRSLRTDCRIDARGRCVEESRFTGFWAVDTTVPIDQSVVTQTGAAVRATDPTAFVTETRYNADHEITQVDLPRANRVLYSFAEHVADPLAQGNLLEVRRQDRGLGSEPDIVSTFTYEPRFQFVKTARDPRGFVTTYLYDYEALSGTAGNLVRVTYPTITLGQPTPQVITEATDYNSFGQPTERRDGEGFRTTYSYGTTGDDTGYLVAVVVDAASLSLRTEFTYNQAGLLIGRWSPRAFAGVGRDDTFKTSFEVNELEQTFHTVGRELRDVGTERSDVYRFWDLNGNLLSELREYVEANGTEPSAPSDVNDPSTFPKSSTPMTATWAETTHAYNLLNYRAATTVDAVAGTGPGGAPHRLTSLLFYDQNDNVAESRTPLAFRHTTTYDERDLVHTQTRGAGTAAAGTYTTDVDRNGNVVETRDALANPTRTTLDGFDRVVLVRDAASHFSTTRYDPSSNVIQSESFDAGGTLLARTLQSWDEFDRNFRVARLAVQHDGVLIGGDGLAVSTTLHDRNSRIVLTVDPNSVSTQRFYDGANRLTVVRDNVSNEFRYMYNLDSAVTQTDFHEINGLTAAVEISHTEVLLDPLNRRIAFRDQRFDPVSRDTQVDFVLDGWSRTVLLRDALDVQTQHAFDLLSRRTRSIRKPSATTSDWIVTDEVYDDDSRVIARRVYRDGLAGLEPQTTGYAFDSRDRLTAVTRPDGDTWSISWDAQSNRTGWQDPLGTQVSDSFDPRNLVAQRVIARGTGIRGATREAYLFDGLRRITFAANYETRGATEHELTVQTWAYNTLSRPEEHRQRLRDHQGFVLADFTTGARWDRASLVTAHRYSDGRTVTYSRDGLNRVRETRDQTAGGTLIARYDYAGPGRLIERTHGNGTVMKVVYESAGCACGGFSGVVESVQHETAAGAPLFGDERRYDVRGDVTAERNRHLGDEGSVYRYDGAQRLVAESRGADLRGSAFGTLADPTQPLPATPQTKHWALDTRGNWTTLADTDGAGNTVQSTAFAPDQSTNVYNSVGGQGFTYDVLEQMTFDPLTQLYYAYDYKGQRVCVDEDSDFSSPERFFGYDAHGRLRTEERWFEASPTNPASASANGQQPDSGGASESGTTGGATGTGAQCDAPNDVPSEVLTIQASAGGGGGWDPTNSPTLLQFVSGTDVTSASGGTDGTSPQDATSLPVGGGTVDNGVVATVETVSGGTPTTYWRCGNGQDTVLGVTDATGTVTMEYHQIDAYGSMSEQEVTADAGPGSVVATAPSPFGTGITRLTLAAGVTVPNLQPGQPVLLVVASQAGRLSGTVVAIGTNAFGNVTLDLRDPAGVLQMSALGASLRAFNLHDPVALVLRFAPVQQGTVGPPQPDPPGPSPQRAIITDAAANFAPLIGNVISVSVPTPGGTYTYYTHIQGLFGGNPTMALVPWEQVYANATMTTYTVYPTQGNGGATCSYLAGPPVVNGNTTTWHFEAAVPAYVQGWWFEPSPASQTYYQVGGVGGNGYQVNHAGSKGITPGAPPGVTLFEPPVGTRPTTGTARGPGPATGGPTQVTYAGGWHLPSNSGVPGGTPGAGSLGGQGRSAGPDRAGEIHNWHRDYKPSIGRWLTPDPADTPWTNRQEYVGGRPVAVSDPTGLYTAYIRGLQRSSGPGAPTPAQATTTGIDTLAHGDSAPHDVFFQSVAYTEAIKEICSVKCATPDEPICLVGHSWGAREAISIANYFVDHECPCLFAIGSLNECGKLEIEFETRWMKVRIAYLAMIDATNLVGGGWTGEIPSSVDNVSNDYQSYEAPRGTKTVTVSESTKLLHQDDWGGLPSMTPQHPRGDGPPIGHTNIDDDLRVQSRIAGNVRKYGASGD